MYRFDADSWIIEALALFNTSSVTPVYYTMFTTATIVTSTVLYQGFEASPVDIVTVVFGFFVICVSLSLSLALCWSLTL